MTVDQAFDSLPGDPASLAGVVQGLLMHEHIAPAYGLTLSVEQHAQAHVRPVEQMLQAITKRDPRPLTATRAAGTRRLRHLDARGHPGQFAVRGHDMLALGERDLQDGHDAALDFSLHEVMTLQISEQRRITDVD